jgi:hypothetical protein
MGIHRQFSLGRAELAQIDAVQLVEKKIEVVEVVICKAEQPASLRRNRDGELSA